MRRRVSITNILAYTLIAVLAACGDPATTVSGTVRDETGQPLEGVTVVLESQVAGGFRKESEQTTDQEGTFSFVAMTSTAKNVRLRFSKPGLREAIKEAPASQVSKIDVQMKKEP